MNRGLTGEQIQQGLPANQSPLRLPDYEEYGPILEEQYGIPRRYPSILRQIGIAKTAPGDDNNQDISSLVGKVGIRTREQYAQDYANAYNYSGGLCSVNQSLLGFVEMFKAPIKVLQRSETVAACSNYL